MSSRSLSFIFVVAAAVRWQSLFSLPHNKETPCCLIVDCFQRRRELPPPPRHDQKRKSRFCDKAKNCSCFAVMICSHSSIAQCCAPSLRDNLCESKFICFFFCLSCFKLFPEENRSEFQGQAEQVLLYLKLNSQAHVWNSLLLLLSQADDWHSLTRLLFGTGAKISQVDRFGRIAYPQKSFGARAQCARRDFQFPSPSLAPTKIILLVCDDRTNSSNEHQVEYRKKEHFFLHLSCLCSHYTWLFSLLFHVKAEIEVIIEIIYRAQAQAVY